MYRLLSIHGSKTHGPACANTDFAKKQPKFTARRLHRLDAHGADQAQKLPIQSRLLPLPTSLPRRVIRSLSLYILTNICVRMARCVLSLSISLCTPIHISIPVSVSLSLSLAISLSIYLSLFVTHIHI